MYAKGAIHCYIEELCQLNSGDYIIPHNWMIRGKKLTARCSWVSIEAVCGSHILIANTLLMSMLYKGRARSSSEQGSEAWETRSRVLGASKEQDMHGNGGLGFSTDAA